VDAAASLTGIRNAILPENSQLARFSTTVGPELREVQGIVYVGAHPGVVNEDRILWFKIEHGPGSDNRFYPTVYTLWQNPCLVPLLHTPGLVMRKLCSGADLMTPGLANGPPFPERAVKGAVVTVASLDTPTVPLVVGVCEIDIASLGEVQGVKGHAVRGAHWQGDELWAWNSSSRPGQPAPEYLEGWDKDAHRIEEGLQRLGLADLNEEDEQEGGVPLSKSPESPSEAPPVEQETEPTTKGMVWKDHLS
jgi:translation initiation factor 2D